jgi:hypothetical protein
MTFRLQTLHSDSEQQAYCEVCDKVVEAVALIKSTWVCADCIRAALDELALRPSAEPRAT